MSASRAVLVRGWQEAPKTWTPTQCIGFFRALVHHGVEAELVMYPNEGHGVRRDPSSLIDYLTRVIGWFERHMPSAPSQAR